MRGELERAGRQSQINTFGGGVNEVQREIVATAGLGMKRPALGEAVEEPPRPPSLDERLQAFVGRSGPATRAPTR